MIKFILSHIFLNKIRSFSIILSIVILIFIMLTGIFLEKNISTAINYYSHHGNNELKVSFFNSTNLMSLFQKEKWLNEEMVEKISTDTSLEKVQVFRLVHTPVSAKFWFFSFSLESDIPVFSVTDSTLTWAKIPVGISRSMIDLYNTQFAGSSGMFPIMKEKILLWQEIEFTFWKSKIFQSSSSIAKPIIGTISSINNNFPALGIVLPESIVRQKMQETGYNLWNPYKIIAYMKPNAKIQDIRKKYKNIHPVFEIDEIQKTKSKINFIAHIFLFIQIFIFWLFWLFFAFLLGWYFRERKYIFQMTSLFELKNYKSYIITLGEPIIFSVIGVSIGGIISHFSLLFFKEKTTSILIEKWITLPIENIPIWSLFINIGFLVIIIFVLIFILEYMARKKYKFK